MALERDELSVRPRIAGWVWIVVLALCGGIAVVDALIRGSWLLAAVVAAWVLVAVWAVRELLLRPALTADRVRIRVRNPWVDHLIPWSQFASAEAGLNLTVSTTDGRVVRVWAVPTSGFAARRRSLRSRASQDLIDERIEDDSPHSPTIASSLERMSESLPTAAGDHTAYTRVVDTGSLCLGGALVVLAIALTVSL